MAKAKQKSKAKKPEIPCGIFFELADASPVTIAARLTNVNNSATSLFRLTDITDAVNPKLIGVTATQSDRAVFVVPPSHFQTGRCNLVLDFLPVAQSKDDVTLSLSANQNGAALAGFDDAGEQLKPGPNGIAVCSVAIGAPIHCPIFLVPSS